MDSISSSNGDSQKKCSQIRVHQLILTTDNQNRAVSKKEEKSALGSSKPLKTRRNNCE
jgi:hypothetical protein